MRIINITGKAATADQLKAGVFEPEEGDMLLINDLLSFEKIPSKEQLQNRADDLAQIALASGAKCALIDGAPYLMSRLEISLSFAEITPLYSFLKDGKHAGFVKAN